MSARTYLNESVKNGYIMRWVRMPIKVYIAPMNFYSKKGVNANEVDRSINFVEKFGDIDMLFKINDYTNI